MKKEKMPGIDKPYTHYLDKLDAELGDNQNYVIQRYSPAGKEHEIFYGPYNNINTVNLRMFELIENFVREHEADEARVVQRDKNKAVVILKDPTKALGNRKKIRYFYYIKPIVR